MTGKTNNTIQVCLSYLWPCQKRKWQNQKNVLNAKTSMVYKTKHPSNGADGKLCNATTGISMRLIIFLKKINVTYGHTKRAVFPGKCLHHLITQRRSSLLFLPDCSLMPYKRAISWTKVLFKYEWNKVTYTALVHHNL